LPNRLLIEDVRAALRAGQWLMTHHARERAGKRFIDVEALVEALIRGEILEEYGKTPGGQARWSLDMPPAGRSMQFARLTRVVYFL
jgi:hypothetical protein